MRENDTTGFCIFDNAQGHRAVEDKKSNGVFEIRRLPKYSPFLIMVQFRAGRVLQKFCGAICGGISCCKKAKKYKG